MSGGRLMERIQKVIANSGVCSRRKAEELIKAGRVTVDGKIAIIGTSVSEKNLIEIDGIKVEQQDKVYYLLNKPRGVVTTTSDDKNRKTVLDLITTDKRIYPVGRLDYDTTGALLLTNDGEFANLMMHPKNEIDKVYIAKLDRIIKPDEVKKLKQGVLIDDNVLVKASRVKVRKIDYNNENCLVEIIIHEGKNHQVKKMFESLGIRVDKLKRERIAFLDVLHLNSGEYRELNKKEVHQLYALASTNNKEKKSSR